MSQLPSEEDLGKLLFIFAKEFGWGWDYIRDIPYKIFSLYVRELLEYSKEQEAASHGKKYKKESKPLTADDKERRDAMIAKMAEGMSNGKNN